MGNTCFISEVRNKGVYLQFVTMENYSRLKRVRRTEVNGVMGDV